MLAEQMGLKKRKRLKPDALPTLFARHVPTSGPGSSSAPVSTARKREPASSSTVCTGGPPKKRMAFEKRERLRVSQLLLRVIITCTLTTLVTCALPQ